MSEPRQQRQQDEQRASASKDIANVLKGWDYEPGTINVRKINGSDGSPKLQMRLDLGLLQMEINGRPDGLRPHGFESLLEYFEALLRDHHTKHGTELGFTLDGQQCQQLREEAGLYYHRYLSLFVLEDFKGVVRDTSRNLRVLDLCGKFASEEQDRLILEQYRPYITMMNTRAAASIEFKEKNFSDALATIEQGIDHIREFFVRFNQEEAFEQSNEVKVLKSLADAVRRKLPVDPLRKLEALLENAVKEERYEQAARLRDRISELRSNKTEISEPTPD